MKVHEILNEGQNTRIMLVDFQPAYENAPNYSDALQNVTEYLNRTKPSNVLIFFNGDEVGIEDTKHAVYYHYTEYGMDEEVGENFNFREKGYSFFRNWMDHGDIEDNEIIKIIRYMAISRINDSREIDEKIMIDLFGQDKYLSIADYIDGDNIYLPDINIAELKSFSGALIGGGGKHECLREIQILMNAFNIKYKAVRDWIY